MSDTAITKSQRWKDRIEQWQTSGKSITSWCKDNNISYNTFLYWRKRLDIGKEHSSQKQSSTFIELQDGGLAFSGIELQIEGISLHIYQQFDEATLIRCLRLLRNP
jgi:hypothetical protein